MPKLIDAYDRTTGKKVRIPANWLGHPVFGENFALTLREKRRAIIKTEDEPELAPN